MKEIKLQRSGLKLLDLDLDAVEAVLNDKSKVAAIRAVLADASVAIGEFEAAIPASVLRVALATGETQRAFLQLDETARAAAIAGAAAITDVLGDVAGHPAFSKALARMPEIGGAQPLAKQLAEMGPGFDQVSRIQSASVFLGQYPKLRPALKIGLYSASDKLLFDSILLWPTAVFVIGTLMEHLATEMEHALELHKLNAMVVDEKRLMNSASSLLEGFDRLTKQLEEFKILIPSDDESASESPPKAE